MDLTSGTCNQLLVHFLPHHNQWDVSSGKSGYNNTTRYVKSNNDKFILRIYDTHKDDEKVKLEHEVLLKLNEIQELPFKVPQPVFTEKGETFLRLQDGSNKIACLYSYIDGENPNFEKDQLLYSFGQKTGFLLDALNKISVNQSLIYRPYYEIEHTHPSCSIDFVTKWCKNPPQVFEEYQSKLTWIAEQMAAFQLFLPQLKALPHQLIHGDLNASNVLCRNGKINAILDFEFVTNDLRVMEAAVCLSEIMIKEQNESMLWEKFRSFIEGFSSVMTLTKPEIEALPVLIQLRRLDVFVHFLGRYMDGIDKEEILKEQIGKTAANPNWLSGGGEKLTRLWKRIDRG
ncbi:hypothetical protein WQ54_11815 [Bacillus sp. SA1-12]|uniref:phosphotransferase n=1 Tax=Bacillus sp. SA1-12 TaxID=1455638 RepID=UPI000625254F|nr:phosphotransferase [Bacillus sp. SA1-12]KKI91973.1 hypothetical protein WQ54_11815 [Bacillus sp. SA1-12]